MSALFHFLAVHFWRGLARLAWAIYLRRREPALWLLAFIVLELVVLWIVILLLRGL